MKKFNLLLVLLSLTMAMACGDKDKKSKSNGFPVYNQYQSGVMTPSTQEGTFNVQSGLVTVAGYTFQAPAQIHQQSMQYLNQFFQQTYSNPQGYQMVAQSTYRVRITGYVLQTGGVQPGGFVNPQQQQIQSGNILVISAPLQAY